MRRNGFTFIETLIVCSIIAVLAGLAITATVASRKKTMKAKALIHMDQIAAAINSYAVDFGNYPPDNTFASSSSSLWFYLGATFHKGANSSINAGPYLDFSDIDIANGVGLADFEGDGSSNDAVKVLVDPWGNEYAYSLPGVHNVKSYDLSSGGGFGSPGGVDIW